MKSTKKQKLVQEDLRKLLPMVPLSDFLEIEKIAGAGHLRHLPPTIISKQAITTHIRHNHTEYDAYLAEGYDADSARHFVLDEMNEVIRLWGGSFKIEDK